MFLPKLLEDAGDLVEYIQPDYQLELASLPEVEQAIPVASPSSQPEEMEIGLEVIPVPTSGEEEALPTPEEGSPTPTPEEEISTSVPEEEQPEEWESGSAIEQNGNPTQEVIVAILDTGIDVTHPDLEGRFVDGYDFCNQDDSVYDEILGMEQAHGTHIAGIIAANAPQAKLMPLKVFENGRAYTSDLIAAIEYAENNGAAIANCSWGATDNNRALREAMEESSLFFVCAAGE